MNKKRVGILGSTGFVGQHFIESLKNHPQFELVALTASDNSKGKKYNEVTNWAIDKLMPDYIRNEIVVATSIEELIKKDVDLVFSALPGDLSKNIEFQIATEGISVFSNAKGHRMEKKVPILIPEINADHIKLVKGQEFENSFIITNSNCSTSGLVFGLKPLIEFGIKNVFVNTYQSVSGAGIKGVGSVEILGNVIPFIDQEEKKMEIETKKILGKYNEEGIEFESFDIHASCARVPVKFGHLESVMVELREKITLDEIKDNFLNFSGEPQELKLHTAPENPIVVLDEKDAPQPSKHLNIENGMEVSIGRIRQRGNVLQFFLLVHNTIRGAAGASVLNAEYAFAKGYLK